MPKNWIGPETQGLCIAGVNTAVRPDLIEGNQIVWGTNMQVRDGKPRTRGAFVQRAVLPTGIIQGAGYYSLRSGMMVVSIGGELTRLTFLGNNVFQNEIPLGFVNSPTLKNAWMVETQDSFIIQDGQSDAIIYNGSIARRADPTLKEVPRGTMMAYGNGRMWVATGGGQTLLAGDIAGTATNSDLFFTETTYLQGGGGLYFPAPIAGLSFLPANNTATGYGALMVFGANFTKTIRAEITQRDYWAQIPGFQVDTLDGIGAASQYCIVRVNQDLYWRDAGGEIRSLRAAAADQESPGNSPLSREVSRIVNYDTKWWLDQCSGTYFDNRVFFTASPFLLPNHAVGFKNLICLDCAPLATMRGKAPPAYDGQYCGTNFVRLVTGRFNGQSRMFAFSTDDDGTNRLWEWVQGEREDSYLTDSMAVRVPHRIKCEAEFRRFNFGDPTRLKQLMRADFYPAEIEGDVNVKLYWRVGNRNQWQFCDGVDFCAEMTDPEGETPHEWVNLASQERAKIKSFTFPDLKDDITNYLQTVGYDFQIRLVWEGNMLIDRIDLWARVLSDEPFSNIPETSPVCVQDSVSDNVISYRIVPES